jgi:general secretion pathway protein D
MKMSLRRLLLAMAALLLAPAALAQTPPAPAPAADRQSDRPAAVQNPPAAPGAQPAPDAPEAPKRRVPRPPRARPQLTPAPAAPPAPGAAQGNGAAPSVVAPPPAAPPAAGAPPEAPAPAPGTKTDLPLPGEKEFNECRRLPAGKRVVVNLKPDSELADLVGWIKAISCRPFIIPANVRQSKVTVIVPEAITANEAYRIFLSALESMGLTIQPEGRVLKIIEANRARESSIPVIGPGREPPQTEQYVTRLLRLQYVFPEEIVQVLNRLKGRDGDITPYAPTNTLIITDLASNIRRMEEVVRALDVPMTGEKIWVIRLKNVVASEVAQMLQQIFGVGKTGPGTAQPRRVPPAVTKAGDTPGPTTQPGASEGGELSISQIVPDERTNSLILVSTEKTYERVLALIRRLEQQGGEMGAGGGRIHVYFLENAKADELATVLGGLGVSVQGGGGSQRRGGRPGGAPAPQPQPGQGGGSGMFQDEVRITPDQATNSLVILANSKDYLTVRDLIQRLDLPRRQVFIEATVMEISLSKARDLGVSYHGGYQPDGQNTLLGGFKGGNVNSLNPLALATLAGLAGGAFGTPLTNVSVLGQANATIPSWGVVIQALQNNSDVNILQNPTLLTTDNEKATIQVGQNLPFPGSVPLGGGIGGLPGAGGAGGISGVGFFSPPVQRQDVALKLEITPHINASDMVRLEIKNEISDVAEKNYNGLGPATNKRTLETTAVVRDQQPVVLGGILRDRVAESVTKIPLLGDIPILGYLFKTKSKEVQKQMLLIVLTPYVIRDASDLRRIFERKMQERREFIETYSLFGSEKDFDKVVDYTRKRGVLEEINRTALEAEREAGEIRAAEQSLRRDIEAGPVELPAPPARNGGGGAPAPSSLSPGVTPGVSPPATPIQPQRLVPAPLAPPPPAPTR